MYRSGEPIPQSDVPATIWARVCPEAPFNARKLIAAARLPMAPAELIISLSVLVRDPDPELAVQATESLRDVPESLLTATCANPRTPGSVLDVLGHVLASQVQYARSLVNNTATHDETVIWMARHMEGPVLEAIAGNQTRLLAEPRIIESLIANPAMRTPTLAPVIELALRQGIDTSRIRGFHELAEAFFSDLTHLQRQLEDAKTQEERDQVEIEAHKDEEAGIDEDIMARLIRYGSDALRMGGEEDDDEEVGGRSLRTLIREMTYAQKVRLALMGDITARGVLIRDTKKGVAMTVLKSPRLTEKEITAFAGNRNIHEDIIRKIAQTREWTRGYQTKLSLVGNPKCPPNAVMGFMRMLRSKDLRNLSRAKNVPAYVSRGAKELLSRKRA